MEYDLAGRDEFQVLKYSLKYSYDQNVPYPNPTQFTSGTAGITFTDTSNVSISVPVPVHGRIPFQLIRSKRGRRLTFSCATPGNTVWHNNKCRRYKLTHQTVSRSNFQRTDPLEYAMADSIIFSLSRKKLKIFAVESVYGNVTDITAFPEMIAGFFQMCYSSYHPSIPHDTGSSMLSIVAKELLSMALRENMDVDYLLHSYRMMSTPDNIIQHLSSPFLMSQKKEHLLFLNAQGYTHILTYNSMRSALKKTFGRCNSNLLREVGKYLKCQAVNTPNYGDIGTHTYTYIINSSSTGTYSNKSLAYIDLNALDIVKFVTSIFDTLDYQDRYIAFFLNSDAYSSFSGISTNQIDIMSLSLIKGFPENKRWRLLTENSEDGLPIQNLNNVPYISPWKNLNLLRDTYSQLNEYPVDKIPAKLKDKYPHGLLAPDKWETIKDLHDKVSRDYNIIKAEANNKEITFSEYIQLLDGTTVLDTELVLPKDTATLVDWGKKLKNCIASYGDRVLNGSTYVFALYKDGEPFINCEVSPSTHGIIQIRVYSNKEAPAEYRAKVQEIWDDMRKIIDLKPSDTITLNDGVGNMIGYLAANPNNYNYIVQNIGHN